MATYTARAFSRTDLPELNRLVSGNARARWPGVTYLLNSDVAWRLPGSAPKDNIRLWFDAAGIAAYAWISPGAPSDFDLRCDLGWDHPIAAELIDWLETRTRALPPFNPWLLAVDSMAAWERALDDNLPSRPVPHRTVQLITLETDEERIRFLASRGYEHTSHFSYSLTRDLGIPIPDIALPEGMRLRHVTPDDFDQRVGVHRDSWHKSTFTLDQYLRVRGIPSYVPELDLVAEDESGVFGAYCIGWIDEDLGVGSFEPVGTRPAFRRLGLGQQVNFEGLRRMKQFGMHSAKIGTAGFNDRAFGLYTSCGFKFVDKERTYARILDG